MYCFKHISIICIKKEHEKCQKNKVILAINRWASHNRCHVDLSSTCQFEHSRENNKNGNYLGAPSVEPKKMDTQPFTLTDQFYFF